MEARGIEILDWLKDKAVEKYLVIDDEHFDICGEKCNVIPKEFFLQTDGNEGLLNRDALKIISHFKFEG